MNADDRLWMVKRKEGGYACSEVVAIGAIAGISEHGHEPMPALRDVPIVDADLVRAGRESIAGQGGYDQIEVFEQGQHTDKIEEAAGPAVCEDEREAAA
jgi:hypothetical protein